jgi:hypothetical protein
MARTFDTFQKAWDWYFAGAVPVSWTLKEALFPRWLRFHSLPESQRYPANEDDFAVLLARQNTLAAEVLGEGAACWTVSHIALPDEGEDAPWLAESRAELARAGLKPVMRAFHDDTHYEIFAGRVIWRNGAFDDMLRRIAAWEDICFWISDTGAAFAPYDGGVDLILPDATHIVRMSRAHSDWLSSVRDGY